MMNFVKLKEIITWDDLLFYTGSSPSAECVSCPRKEEYNEPSVSLYKDGSVWVSGSRGSVMMFRNCPYNLMLSIFTQRYSEVNGEENNDTMA